MGESVHFSTSQRIYIFIYIYYYFYSVKQKEAIARFFHNYILKFIYLYIAVSHRNAYADICEQHGYLALS